MNQHEATRTMTDPATPITQTTPVLVGGLTLGTFASHVHILFGLVVLGYTLRSAYLRSKREKLLLDDVTKAHEHCRQCRWRLNDKENEN